MNVNLNKLMVQALLAASLLVASSNSTAASEEAKTGTLVLRNGDSLPGQISSVAEGVLNWECSLFASPVKMRQEAIRRISLPTDESSATAQADYQIETVGDDLLFGRISRIAAGVAYMDCDRHGEIQIKLSQIAKIRNLKHSATIVSGFSDFEGWGSLKNQKTHWQTESGNLYTSAESANVYRRLDNLPDTVDILLRCSFSASPDFSFGFEIPRSTEFDEAILRLETWDGSLVLVHADGDFEILMEEIPEDTRELGLSILWNRKTNRMVIRNQQQLLGEVVARTAAEDSKPGFFFKNRAGDLRISQFRVSASPVDAKSQVGVIVNKEGESIRIENQLEFDGRSWTLGKQSLPAKEMYQVWLAEAQPRKKSAVKLRYRDGAQISGKLVSAGSGQLMLMTAFSDSEIKCNTNGLITVDFGEPNSAASGTDEPHESPYQLTCQFGTIHGQLGFAALGDNLAEWTPFGSSDPVKLAYKVPFTIQRVETRNAKERPGNSLVDTLHLTNGDLIACRVDTIDSENCVLQSAYGERSVSLKLVKAIDLGRKQPRQKLTFEHAQRWKLLRQNGQHSDCVDQKEVRLGRGDILVHPNFQGDQLRFALRRNGRAFSQMKMMYGLRMRLYRSNEESNDGIGISIIAAGKNTFHVSGDSNRSMVAYGPQRRTECKSNQVEVVIRLVDSTLTIALDGVLAHSMKVDRDTQICGSVVTFKNISQETLGGLNDADGTDWFDISQVESEFLFGRTARPVIVSQSRLDQLLTVPRAQRHYPPNNIIVSTSGDFLRGRLTSLTSKKLSFESGNSNFSFDRSRIANVVWFHGVKDPEDNDEEQEESSSVPNRELQFLLDDGQRISMMPKTYANGTLTNGSSALGKVSLNLTNVNVVRYANAVAEGTTKHEEDYSSWVACFAEPPHKMAAQNPAEKSSPLVGTQAIDFESEFAADGKTFRLSEQKGKVVVLDFWATWCGPCIASMPKLISDIESLSADDVVLVAVNQGETAEKVSQFIQARNWNLNSVLDRDSKIGEQYQVTGIPKSVVITPDGIISAVNTGPAHDIKADIERARKGELASPPVVVQVGAEAPEIESLFTSNQRQFRLSDLRGKVVVLDFWATWSDECTARMPKIMNQIKAFDSEDIVLIGVNQGENAPTINAFIEAQKWSLRSIQDPQMSIGQSYRVDSLPRTIVIDQAGKIVSINSQKSDIDLTSDIEKALLQP